MSQTRVPVNGNEIQAARVPVKDPSTDVPRANGSEVQRGQHPCAKQLVLADVRSWPSWGSDDDAGLPDDAVTPELLSGASSRGF